MDLGAVKDAPADALARGAAAAARNACGLVEDAELLSGAGRVLDDAQAFAEDTDRLKQRGLYVDVDRSGNIREPSEVTAAEVREQLGRARQAAWAASALLDSSAPLPLADSGPAEAEIARALVSAFAETRLARSAEAAAHVLRITATKLRGQM